MRFLSFAVLVAHGWVHGVMWALPFSAEARADLPMDPAHSWLLGDARSLAFGVALVVAAAFLVAGIALLVDASWWPVAAVAAAVLSTLLLTVWFSPWWALGYLINAAVVVAAWRSLT